MWCPSLPQCRRCCRRAWPEEQGLGRPQSALAAFPDAASQGSGNPPSVPFPRSWRTLTSQPSRQLARRSTSDIASVLLLSATSRPPEFEQGQWVAEPISVERVRHKGSVGPVWRGRKRRSEPAAVGRNRKSPPILAIALPAQPNRYSTSNGSVGPVWRRRKNRSVRAAVGQQREVPPIMATATGSTEPLPVRRTTLDIDVTRTSSDTRE